MIYILVRTSSAFERVTVCGAVSNIKQANFWNSASPFNAYYAVPVGKTPKENGYDLVTEVCADDL